jgi:hypothetical protein
MANNKQTASSGISLGGVIFIVFLILKLAEIGPVANWSWWWVTSPLWIPIALVLTVLCIVGLLFSIAKILKS